MVTSENFTQLFIFFTTFKTISPKMQNIATIVDEEIHLCEFKYVGN